MSWNATIKNYTVDTVVYSILAKLGLGGGSDHHLLADLTGHDDHTQYWSVAGRAGDIFNILNTTDSTSTVTGSGIISGGVGVAKRINAGGPIVTTDTTGSTSTTTGALIVSGGIGAAGIVWADSFRATTTGTGKTALMGLCTDLTVGLKYGALYAGKAYSTNNGYGFNYIHNADGSATNQFQLDIFGTNILNITGTSVGVSLTTTSTSSSTGALVISGGVGVSGAEYVGGDLHASSGTASTTTTTGALVVSGGVGVSGAIHAGSTSQFSGNMGIGTTPDANIPLTVYRQGGYEQLTIQNFNGAANVIGHFYTTQTAPGGLSIWASGGTTNPITIGNNSYGNAVSIPNTTASTSTTTGALTIGGGLGVGGCVTATNMSCITAPVAATDVARLTDIPGQTYVPSSSTFYEVGNVLNTTAFNPIWASSQNHVAHFGWSAAIPAITLANTSYLRCDWAANHFPPSLSDFVIEIALNGVLTRGLLQIDGPNACFYIKKPDGSNITNADGPVQIPPTSITYFY